eukprot:CAMPEP_0178422860 /NCGR_PEP_ID=MMETSP0689_2-20121128/27393_1 /TAXON_ID=160604 /ORGANISM="Amphidinium massartii, Strain CS-259" /LENGTH=179 /DNA_ID=CAMNT_0020044441 /DNA_START=41 /DNA_END=577 /DNA_ORIENTATION=-
MLSRLLLLLVSGQTLNLALAGGLQPHRLDNISQVVTTTAANCSTRSDVRAEGLPLTRVAAPGTPCLFGVDPRDEGFHCIAELTFGSYGWCWTTANQTLWGPCSYGCPLYGQAKVLGDRLNAIAEDLASLKKTVEHRTISLTSLGSQSLGERREVEDTMETNWSPEAEEMSEAQPKRVLW